MDNQFWSMYCEMKNDECYYLHYSQHSKRIDDWLTVCTTLPSLACVAVWSVWQQLPFLWAFFIAVSQIISGLRFLMPFSKRVSATSYFLPEMAQLLNNVDHTWNQIQYSCDTYSDTEINDMILSYQMQYATFETKYIGSTLFPHNMKILKKAERDRAAFFKSRYNVDTR